MRGFIIGNLKIKTPVIQGEEWEFVFHNQD